MEKVVTGGNIFTRVVHMAHVLAKLNGILLDSISKVRNYS